FSLMMEETLKRGRRTIEGHGEFLPHHCYRHVDTLHASQHAWHEVALGEARRVPAQRHLIVSPAVDVVKDRTRQASAGERAKIMEIMAVAQPHRVNRKPSI